MRDRLWLNWLVLLGSVALVLGVVIAVRESEDPEQSARFYIVATDEHPPLEWLAEEDQEELAEFLLTAAAGAGWVAGCVWEREPAEIGEVFGRPGEVGELRGETTSGRAIAAVLVPGADASDSFDAVEAPGRFCYVAEIDQS